MQIMHFTHLSVQHEQQQHKGSNNIIVMILWGISTLWNFYHDFMQQSSNFKNNFAPCRPLKGTAAARAAF